MRSFKNAVLALALSTSCVFADTPRSLIRTVPELEGEHRGVYPALNALASSSPPSKTIHLPRTNAERFAAGLPPLPPTRRSRRSGARRQQASILPCVPTKGYIQVNRMQAGINFVIGFITQTGSNHFTASTGANSLVFTICITPGSTNIQTMQDITVETTYADLYPYFGGVASPSNVALMTPGQPGSNSHYAYIQGTSQTPPDSPPINAPNSIAGTYSFESAIWNYDPLTSHITANWINPDGTSISTGFVYLQTQQFLLLTGDPAGVATIFGGAEVTFTFVPLVVAPPAASETP